jgi:hypothetical protein
LPVGSPAGSVLRPDERTSSGRLGMSEKCHKRSLSEDDVNSPATPPGISTSRSGFRGADDRVAPNSSSPARSASNWQPCRRSSRIEWRPIRQQYCLTGASAGRPRRQQPPSAIEPCCGSINHSHRKNAALPAPPSQTSAGRSAMSETRQYRSPRRHARAAMMELLIRVPWRS